jgi:hypothetical protein
MFIQQIFELTLTLDTEKFKKVKKHFRSDNSATDSDFLSRKGITAHFHNDKYKKKVVLNIIPYRFVDGNEVDHTIIVHKIKEFIDNNFGFEYQFNDFRITGIILMTNIDVHNQEKVTSYLKVLQRIGRVKGFSPLRDDRMDSDISFCLAGNSNGIEFLLYDLKALILRQLKNDQYGHKRLEKIMKKSEGLLRAEVRLTKHKAICNYTDEIDTAKQLKDLMKKGERIFLESFMRVVPFGDFLKKSEAVECIKQKVADKTIRRKMLHLLKLLPEKKSLHLAQKALNCRNIDQVMDTFSEIEVSPITIPKRHNEKILDNLYKYM